MRVIAGLSMLFMLGTFAPASLFRPHPVPHSPWVRFAPLSAEAFAGCRMNGVGVEAGWVLTSNHPRFGGLSGLHVERGGAIAISDGGEALAFPLAQQGRVPLTLHALDDLNGPKKLRDSESLTIAGKVAWVGFEHDNRIGRYRLPDWSPNGEVRPAEMRDWPRKQGPEAMVRLTDGRFLLLPEGKRNALLFSHDPVGRGTATRLHYRAPQGFKPVDVAELGDGRLLIVNRRYTILEGPAGFSAALGIATLPGPGGKIESREVARFAAPCIHDNFEAVSVTHDNGRETIWLASDDNFGPLQRTLLLKLKLQP